MPVQEEGEALQEETDRPPTLSFPGGQEESSSLRQGRLLGLTKMSKSIPGLRGIFAQWLYSDSVTSEFSKRAELAVSICKVSPTTGEKQGSARVETSLIFSKGGV